MEITKIRDLENLKISQTRLRDFQKEMRCMDIKSIDNIEQEFVTYLLERKRDVTLEEMDLISEAFEYMRNKIRQGK